MILIMMASNIQEIIFQDDEEEAVMAAILLGRLGYGREEADLREETINVDIEGWRALSNASFKENFRMDRVVFQRLIVSVGNHMQNTNRMIRHRTNFELCLMMGLWPLFNKGTFRSSGHHFGRKKAVINYHYSYLIEVLREMRHLYIKWPDALEREHIKAQFEQRYGYPGVVGAIDGVNIQVTTPLEQLQRYINRHHSYSMLVQAVSDHRLLYRDVYAGEAGCIGDARIFARSPLSRNILTVPEMFCEGELLLVV